MTEKAKKEQKAMLKKEFIKQYRANKKVEVNKYTIDLSNVSQAKACDVLIMSALSTCKSYKEIVDEVLNFIDENDVRFKNYDSDKNAIKKRFLRHVSSDVIQRLSKRLTTL